MGKTSLIILHHELSPSLRLALESVVRYIPSLCRFASNYNVIIICICVEIGNVLDFKESIGFGKMCIALSCKTRSRRFNIKSSPWPPRISSFSIVFNGIPIELIQLPSYRPPNSCLSPAKSKELTLTNISRARGYSFSF